MPQRNRLTVFSATPGASSLGQSRGGAIIVQETARWRGDTFCLPKGDRAVVGVYVSTTGSAVTFADNERKPADAELEDYMRQTMSRINFNDYCYGLRRNRNARGGVQLVRNGAGLNEALLIPVPVGDLPINVDLH